MLDSCNQVAEAFGEQHVPEPFKPFRLAQHHSGPLVRYHSHSEEPIAFRVWLERIVRTKGFNSHLCAARPQHPVEHTKAPGFTFVIGLTGRCYPERAFEPG